MKKLYLILVAASATVQLSFAQWTTSGNNIYNTNPGTVNIGTTNNTPKLNVTGNNSSYIGADISINRTNSLSNAGSSPVLQFNDLATGYGNIIQSYLGQLQFFSNTGGSWAEFMRITGNGNVGIGTTTPGGKLELYNNSNNSTNLVLSADYNNGYRWRFNTVDRGNAIDMDITASNSGDVQQTILTMSPTFSGRPQLALEGNWLVANNGNIGIGTTDNSNWQLATSIYKLAVNGSAIATSMTVKASTSWPDYVFKPAYTLPTLTEVKTYIDKNHHLPEIPTEQQIEKDGLNLGEMNKLLVKKVEELTLYLIEMKKDMANLKEEQIKLRKKIKNISTKTSTK